MKLITLFSCLALLACQGGCTLGPPIDQQTLEQQKQAQSVKKSDAFASGLAQ